jgi:hypothetical protein
MTDAPLVDDGDVTKRLSFGEMSHQLNEKLRIDPNDVLRVLHDGRSNPEGFVRCVERFCVSSIVRLCPE